MAWADRLQKGSVQFIQGIIEQIPEEGGARDAFETLLDRLANTPTKEQAGRLAKLDALEAGGVDNWEWYDQSMEDAGLTGDDGEEEEEEDSDDIPGTGDED